MLRLGATSISRLSSKEGRQGEDPLISLVGRAVADAECNTVIELKLEHHAA